TPTCRSSRSRSPAGSAPPPISRAATGNGPGSRPAPSDTQPRARPSPRLPERGSARRRSEPLQGDAKRIEFGCCVVTDVACPKMAVDEPPGAAQFDRYAACLQPLGVALAVVAQRIVICG